MTKLELNFLSKSQSGIQIQSFLGRETQQPHQNKKQTGIREMTSWLSRPQRGLACIEPMLIKRIGYTLDMTKLRNILLLLLCWSDAMTSAQKLLWSDDFDGSNLDTSVWSYEEGGGGWGNGELQEYTQQNVLVEDGNLIIQVKQDTDSGTITSGRIRSSGKLEFQYGTIEARIKLPNVANGLWPCFWMLGANFPQVGWPQSGSLTILQAGSADALASGSSTSRVGSAAYWEQDGGSAFQFYEKDTLFDITDGFYTYRLEWTPDEIRTSIEGFNIFTTDIFAMDISTSACPECDEFHKPFYFVLNVAAGGAYSGIFNIDELTAPLPAEMVVDYIRIYDNDYTELSGSAAPQPTVEPTVSPTTTPTLAPTEAVDTLSPTQGPTSLPTLSPTLTSIPESTPPTTSTDSPTGSPTREPGAESTSSPTNDSTAASTSLSDQPTPIPPSRVPLPDSKASPPPSPTQEPTTAFQRFEAVGITMRLANVEPLGPALQDDWSKATENHLREHMTDAIGSDLVESMEVSVALVSQDPPYVSTGTRRARMLQQDTNEEEELVFNAMIAIQSEVQVDDVNPYITGAFADDASNAAYMARLKEANVVFEDAEMVSVSPATSVSRVQDGDYSTDEPGVNVGMVVGVTAAALVVCLLGVAVFTRRRKGRNTRRPFRSLGGRCTRTDAVSNFPPTSDSTIADESLYMDTETKLNGRPPSIREGTLYTDSYGNSGSLKSGDDCESSYVVSHAADSQLSYDYEAAFKNLTPSVVDSQSTSCPSTRSSLTALDEFQVNVPPGKVGLVLETTEIGDPVVEEVKPTSPMVGEVEVGDRLLSIDGQDTRSLSAQVVSQVIAFKKDNPVRVFKFGRPKARAT